MHPGAFLRAFATSAAGARLLVGSWLAVALLCTQIPQSHAPLVTGDGLGRSDLLLLASLGLDRLADSALVWLLFAATVVFVVARRLFADECALARHPALAGEPTEATAARLRDALQEVLDRQGGPLASDVKITASAAGLRIHAGWMRAGRRAAWVCATLAVVWMIHAAGQPPPTVIDVPVRTGAAPAPRQVQRAQAGRLVTVAGSLPASCAQGRLGLGCTLELSGKRVDLALRPGQATSVDGQLISWVGTAPDPTFAAGTLQWHTAAADPGQAPRWYAFGMRSGAALKVAALGATMLPVRTTRSGPVIFGERRAAEGQQVFALASPDILPEGRPTARLSAPSTVRLSIAPDLPPGLLAGLIAALLLSAVALFAVPGIDLEIQEVGAVVVVRSANRTALLQAVAARVPERAGPPDDTTTAAPAVVRSSAPQPGEA